jgi:hypothetical protein
MVMCNRADRTPHFAQGLANFSLMDGEAGVSRGVPLLWKGLPSVIASRRRPELANWKGESSPSASPLDIGSALQESTEGDDFVGGLHPDEGRQAEVLAIVRDWLTVLVSLEHV